MVKFNRQQIAELFKRLDSDGDGYLTYQDFCELCEEKIRDIDPFDSIVQSVKEK
jgi:Ca2+-binding EF-hand superfamily protein